MTLEEMRALLAANEQERGDIQRDSEARFADKEDKTEVRGAFVLDSEGNATSEIDDHAGLTETEIERLGELATEDAMLSARIKRGERAEAAAQAGHTARTGADFQISPQTTEDPFAVRSGASPAEMRGQALTAIEKIDADDETREALTQRAQSLRHAVVDQHIIASGNPAYREFFRSMITAENPAMAVMRAASNPEWVKAAAQVDELRASLALTSGYVLPVTVDPTFIRTGDIEANPIRGLATVRTVVTNRHEVNSLGGVSWSFDAEGTEVSDDTATAGNETVDVHMARGYQEYSIETGQDIAGLEAELLGLFNEGADNLEATKFMLGSGTNEPWGLIPAMAAASIAHVTTATATKVEEADLYAIMANLQRRHRTNAVWIAALETYNVLRQLESSGGDRIWSGNVGDGLPMNLVNRPHYESSVMDTVATLPDVFTTGDDAMVYGDVREGYRIAERIGMSVEPVGIVMGANRRPTGKRGLFAHYRVGGNVVNPNALRVLEVG